MTRTVDDTALMLGVMAGYDKLDITSVNHAKEDYATQLAQPVAGFRLGIPVGYFDYVEPEVMHAFEEAVAVLRKLTRGTAEMSLPGVTHLANLGGLGETFAYHEQYYKAASGKYMLPERRRLQGVAEKERWPWTTSARSGKWNWCVARWMTRLPMSIWWYCRRSASCRPRSMN